MEERHLQNRRSCYSPALPQAASELNMPRRSTTLRLLRALLLLLATLAAAALTLLATACGEGVSTPLAPVQDAAFGLEAAKDARLVLAWVCVLGAGVLPPA